MSLGLGAVSGPQPWFCHRADGILRWTGPCINWKVGPQPVVWWNLFWRCHFCRSLPRPSTDLSGFEEMTALVFGLGPVFRIAGLPAVARSMKVPLDLDLVLMASVVANQALVVASGELEFDVRYRLSRGWWMGVGSSRLVACNE